MSQNSDNSTTEYNAEDVFHIPTKQHKYEQNQETNDKAQDDITNLVSTILTKLFGETWPERGEDGKSDPTVQNNKDGSMTYTFSSPEEAQQFAAALSEKNIAYGMGNSVDEAKQNLQDKQLGKLNSEQEEVAQYRTHMPPKMENQENLTPEKDKGQEPISESTQSDSFVPKLSDVGDKGIGGNSSIGSSTPKQEQGQGI